MADDPIIDPITSKTGRKAIYYNGTPHYVPLTITGSTPINSGGSTVSGTAGAPGPAPTTNTTTIQTVVPIQPELDNLAVLQSQYAAVGVLLDAKGSSMNVCQNLPPEIASRYLAEVEPGETCWEFYKRMMAVVQSTAPAPNTSTLTTTAQTLAQQGNTIFTNPFPTDSNGNVTTPGTLTNYNDNPGGPTLLYMLFVGIIMPVANLILDAVYPVAYGLATAVGSATGLGFILVPAFELAYQASLKPAFLAAVQGLVSGAPTLSENVTNYNALLITQHMTQTAQYSTALNWPEAVMMYGQYSALSNQMNAQSAVYSYFTQNYTGQQRVTAAQLGTGAAMPADMAQLMQMHQSNMGGMLNNMTSMLSTDITDTLICCLVRLLGSQSPRWLQALKALLQLTINQQAAQFTSLDAALNSIWADIEQVIMYEVLAQIYNLFDELNNTIKQDLNNFIQSPGFAAQTCPPWNLFSQNMLQFIGGVELSILELATSLNHTLMGQKHANNNFTNNMNSSIYARQLINIIDVIQNALELGTICNSSTVPTNTELQTLFDQLATQLLPLNTTENITSTGNTGSPTGSILSSPTVTARAALMNQFDNCLAKVPQQQVEEMMAWIENLTGNQNG